MTSLEVDQVFPPGAGPAPGSVHERYVKERLAEAGKWGDRTLAQWVRTHAIERGTRAAYVTPGGLSLTWSELDASVDRLAALLVSIGVGARDRVAVYFPDGPVVHALYLATERAGAIAVGIGPRAGQSEVAHLINVTDASVIVTAPRHMDRDMTTMVREIGRSSGRALRHMVIESNDPTAVTVDASVADFPNDDECRTLIDGRALSVADIFLINSTSGTTGMPKCVVHQQNRWLYYHTQVMRTGDLRADDVWLPVIPAPYGFGIWTGHASPIVLGVTTLVTPRFSADHTLELIEAERVNVLAGVTTQFIMMLNSPLIDTVDLSSLRYLYSGGEAIPYHRAEQFEKRTGARVLNFYGSNETGMLSYTTSDDTTEHRLGTGGRVGSDMRVRLFDETFDDVPLGGPTPGQSGCRGPATSLGYYADPDANARLFTPDGWMLTGDLCTVDADGYLSVVGRSGDFIIRGGKNISAVAVEERVGGHPAVAMVAAVGVPDEVFGERVCAVVELRDGESLTLPELQEYLAAEQISKEMWPERLDVVAELPRSSGGKVAKGVLRKKYTNPGR